MGDAATGLLTVRYVNGKVQKFKYERVQQEEGKMSVVTRMQEMLKS